MPSYLSRITIAILATGLALVVFCRAGMTQRFFVSPDETERRSVQLRIRNMFEWPLSVLSNQDYYPLTVGLSFFQQESGADWPRILAAGVMGAAPLILLFLIARRYLVSGHQPERDEDIKMVSGGRHRWAHGAPCAHKIIWFRL